MPLIATLSKNAAAQNGYYVRELGFPVTAFLRFDGGFADVERPGAARLELYNPKTIEAAALGGKTVPLESDLTTPLAHSLNGQKVDEIGYLGFFRADEVRSRTGIKLLEPYQPGKIPVLFIHGLLSTPVTWASMFNDLQADSDAARSLSVLGLFLPDRRSVSRDGRRSAQAIESTAQRSRSAASRSRPRSHGCRRAQHGRA